MASPGLIWSSICLCSLLHGLGFSSGDNADVNIVALTKFSNSFVPHLFKALSVEGDNLVFSSLGLAMNLVMAIESTDGPSVNEIVEVFKIGKTRSRLKRGIKALNEAFEQDSLRDDLAGVFSHVSVTAFKPLAPAYLETLKTFFLANVTTMNESSLQEDIVLSHAQVLELESEIGVVSHWQDYQKLAVYTYLSHHSSASFFLSKNESIRVPMIPQIGVFRGGYVPQIKSYIVELKLQTNCMRLVLIMPNTTHNSGEELQKLSFKSGLDELLNVIPPKELEVLLPQMATIKKDIDFAEFLRNFGVVSIFNVSTSDTKKNNIFIESIRQNAYFSTSFTSVNSASAIDFHLGYKTTPSRPKRQVKTKLIFNKPFLFYLMHCKSGLIVLAGKIVNPTQVPS